MSGINKVIDTIDFGASIEAKHHLFDNRFATSFSFSDGKIITIFHDSISEQDSLYVRFRACNVQTRCEIRSAVKSFETSFEKTRDVSKRLDKAMGAAMKQIQDLKDRGLIP